MVTIKDNVSGVKKGKRYGKWKVLGKPFCIGKTGGKGRSRQVFGVVSKCSCGTILVVHCVNLARGSSKQCTSCGSKKHGLSESPLYRRWVNIKSRCNNPNDKGYKDYGGRGITLCKEWSDSVEEFIKWALGNGYSKGLEVDRIDNNGNYEPKNCRFVSKQVNTNNKRNTLRITAFGETKSISDWSKDKRCKVKRRTLLGRIERGWKPEESIITKLRP